MTNEEKIKQLNDEIEERKIYLKKGFFNSLFSTKQFLVEIFLLFFLAITLPFFKESIELQDSFTVTLFILPIVLLKNIEGVVCIKKAYFEDVETLSDFLNNENIPEVIELSHNRKIELKH